MPNRRLCALIVTVVTAAVVIGPVVRAQRPERQQEVKVPGLDVSLKAGWQLQFHDGCRFAVPGPWHIEAAGNLAIGPDGSNLSIRLFRIESWSAHKGQIKAAFGRVNVVHEDSERRLWFEIGDTPRIQHYVDVSNGLSVCSGLLEIRAATTPDAEDTTRRIVESIGPAPARWPP
jgi:hypothetical protein